MWGPKRGHLKPLFFKPSRSQINFCQVKPCSFCCLTSFSIKSRAAERTAALNFELAFKAKNAAAAKPKLISFLRGAIIIRHRRRTSSSASFLDTLSFSTFFLHLWLMALFSFSPCQFGKQRFCTGGIVFQGRSWCWRTVVLQQQIGFAHLWRRRRRFTN